MKIDRHVIGTYAGKGVVAGIYLFAFSIPVSFVPAQFGIALAVVCWVLQGLASRSWSVYRHPVFIFLAVYYAWNILSSLTSARPTHSLLALADNEWAFLICLMMFWGIQNRGQLRTAVVLFLSVSSVAMIYGIWQVFAGVEIWRGLQLSPEGGFYRAVGFNGFYLTFAGFAVAAFFLSSVLAWEYRKKLRTLLSFSTVAILSLLALLGTFARSLWLAWGAMFPLMGFMRSRTVGTYAIGTLVVLLMTAGLASESLRNRATSIFDPSQNETRLNLWQTSLNIASDRPFLGIGQDNFDYHFQEYRVEGYYDVDMHPHNDYLTVLVSSGIPGLLAWIGVWGTVMLQGLRSFGKTEDEVLRGVTAGALLSVGSLLIGAFFQNYYGTFANCLEWWFLTGLILAAGRLGERSDSTAE